MEFIMEQEIMAAATSSNEDDEEDKSMPVSGFCGVEK
jgi:hypothetical protein